ncbi:MAG: ribbon-helix-helix protein, CopG family [Acidimicrobiia bacterium]
MKRSTTVRIPEELAAQANLVARGRGVSVSALIIDALEAELERVRAVGSFMEQLRALADRDREILDRLAR